MLCAIGTTKGAVCSRPPLFSIPRRGMLLLFVAVRATTMPLRVCPTPMAELCGYGVFVCCCKASGRNQGHACHKQTNCAATGMPLRSPNACTHVASSRKEAFAIFACLLAVSMAADQAGGVSCLLSAPVFVVVAAVYDAAKTAAGEYDAHDCAALARLLRAALIVGVRAVSGGCCVHVRSFWCRHGGLRDSPSVMRGRTMPCQQHLIRLIRPPTVFVAKLVYVQGSDAEPLGSLLC